MRGFMTTLFLGLLLVLNGCSNASAGYYGTGYLGDGPGGAAAAASLPGVTAFVQVPATALTLESGTDPNGLITTAIAEASGVISVGVTGSASGTARDLDEMPWYQFDATWLSDNDLDPDYTVSGGYEWLVRIDDPGARAQGLQFGLKRETSDYGAAAGWYYEIGSTVPSIASIINSNSRDLAYDQTFANTTAWMVVRLMWTGDVSGTPSGIMRCTSWIENTSYGSSASSTFPVFGTGDMKLGMGVVVYEAVSYGEGFPAAEVHMRRLSPDNTGL